jgi:glycolate oxidase iron-sulfur subunit
LEGSSNGSYMNAVFDSHHPPTQELLDTCVHCGFCLATCPTYVLWGKEMDSPRGRIYLMQMARDGVLSMTPQWVEHFDTCLGCMACMPACPSGVDYGKLIEATRGQIARRYSRSRAERWYRQWLFATLPRPDRLRWLRWPLAAYQRTGGQALVRRSGLLKWLPSSLQTMEALMPSLARHEKTGRVTPADGPQRQRVGMLLGCVQREFLSPVNAATARVLAAEGYEVVAPAEQPCCGALLTHAGEEAGAIALAKRMIDVFERAKVETIVINAAGCGSAMKEYGYLLRDDPEYAERARRFSQKCRDVTEVLAAEEPRAVRHPLPLRVAYHDACHLQHAQGVRAQPRALLSQIPGLDLVEIPDAAICCGSAGIFNLVQPVAATELGDRKAGCITPLGPEVVATGNPGCLLQIQSALARAGHAVPVLHTLQVLDASIRGCEPADVLQNAS